MLCAVGYHHIHSLYKKTSTFFYVEICLSSVLVPTEIVDIPVTVEYESTMEDVSFKCQATTDDSTPLEYNWYWYLENEDDMARLYPENNDRITVKDDLGSELILHLKDVSNDELHESYKGFYICEATNGYSTKQATAELIVKTAGPAGN